MKTKFSPVRLALGSALYLLFVLSPPATPAETVTNTVTAIAGSESADILGNLIATNAFATLSYDTNVPGTVRTEATGISGLGGDDRITSGAELWSAAHSSINPMFDQYDYQGKETLALSTGLSGGAGNDTITNAARLTSTARADTDIESAFCTIIYGVSGLPTTATANSTGMDGGAGLNSLFNLGAMNVSAGATNSVFKMRLSTLEFPIDVWQLSDARTTASATAMGINAGLDWTFGQTQTIENHGSLNVQAAADAYALDVKVELYGAANVDDRTTATTEATGIAGGLANNLITHSGSLDVDAVSVSELISGELKQKGFMIKGIFELIPGLNTNVGQFSTVAEASAVGIDGSFGNDTVVNAQTNGVFHVHAGADATSTSVTLSIAPPTGGGGGSSKSVAATTSSFTGLGLLPDATGAAYGDADTVASAAAEGISGGFGNDRILNLGQQSITADAQAHSVGVSADVSVSLSKNWSPIPGAAIASAATGARSEVIGLDGGAGNDSLLNFGRVDAIATAEAHSTTVGAAFKGTFKGEAFGLNTAVTWIDVSSKAQAASLGLSGGAGNDGITNFADVVSSSSAKAIVMGVGVEVTGDKSGLSGGAAIADGTSVTDASAIGIAGGPGRDEVENNANVTAASRSELNNTEASVALNVSLKGLSGSVTLLDFSSHATNTALGVHNTGGGILVNRGVIAASSAAVADTLAIVASLAGGKQGMAFGVALSDLGVNTRADAFGVSLGDELTGSGFLGDTVLNTGSIRAIAGSTNHNFGITASLNGEVEGVVGGVSATRSDILSEANSTAIRTGQGADHIVSQGGGSLAADALAETHSTSVAATFAGTWKGVSLGAALAQASTAADAMSSGITTGRGADWIENSTALTNRASAWADSLTVAATLSFDYAGAAFGMSLVDGRTMASAIASGIDAGLDNDVITNTAAIASSAASRATSDDIAVTVSVAIKGVSAGLAMTRSGLESTAQATGITGGGGDDAIENTGNLLVDATATSKSHVITIDAAEIGAAMVDVTTTVGARAVGIDGNDGIDNIRNAARVNVTATTGIDAMDAAANLIGYASGNVRMTNTVTAIGILSADPALAQTTGETILNDAGGSVNVSAQGTNGLKHYIVQGGGGIIAKAGAEASALAIGLAGTQAGDTLLNAGTINAASSMELQSAGANFQLSGAVLDSGGFNVWSSAAGIEALGGANAVTNLASGHITAFAKAATLAADFNVSFGVTVGVIGIQSDAVARGIHTGNEFDAILNLGSLSVSGESTGTAGALSTGLLGFDAANSLAYTTVEGINAGGGSDWIFNGGSISSGQVTLGDALAHSTSAAMTADLFLAINLVTLGAKAQAIGIAAGDGNDAVINTGSILAGDADSWLAYGEAYAIGGQLAGTAGVFGSGNATATAIGIDGGNGNDGLTNSGSGVITASARAKAETTTEAYDLAAFLLPSAADAGATATATAIGINGGAGDDAVNNAGQVTASAYALALADSTGTITFDIETKIFAETEPKPTATAYGIQLSGGINFAINSGTNIASASAQAGAKSLTGATFESTSSEAYPLPVAFAAGIAGGNDGNTIINTPSALITASASATTTEVNGDPTYANSDDGRDATARAGNSSSPMSATATGIVTGSGADTVLNYGNIAASASADASLKANTHVWYRYPKSEALAYVASTAKGISAGAGNNTVLNTANITANATANASTKSYSWSRDYRATAYSTDNVTATAMGIEADGAVTNSSTGTVSASARATTYAESWTGAENTYATGNPGALAIGITPASGGISARPDTIVNDGVVSVKAAAGEDASGNAVWSSYTDTSVNVRSIRGEGWSTATTDAIGIRLLDRDTTVINNSNITVTSRAQAWTYAKAHSRDYHPAAVTVASADSAAYGILAGNGNDRLVNNGNLTVLSYANAYGQSYSDENVGGFRVEEARATANAAASAFGILTGNGSNTVINAGNIAVTAISTASASAQTEDDDQEVPVSAATASTVGIRTGSGSDTIINRGSITTTNRIGNQLSEGIAIDAGAGNDTVALLGHSLVRGDVLLGSGDDTLELAGTPTVASVVQAGDGTDTLALFGPGQFSANDGLLGFERITKTGAGTFILPQLAGIQTLKIMEGSLQSSGSFAFDSNSVLETRVSRDGTSGQFHVTGNADLAGDLTVLRGLGPFPVGTTTYDLLLAEGGILGVFSGTNLPAGGLLLTFALHYLPDRVQVEAIGRSFASYASNRVERSVGLVLDRVVTQSTGDFATLLDTFQQLSLPEFHSALSSLSPASYDDYTLATHSLMRQYSRGIQQQLDTLRLDSALNTGRAPNTMLPGQNPVLLAYAGAAEDIGGLLAREAEVRADRLNGVWAGGFGQWTHQDSEGGYPGYDFNPSGLALGIDRVFDETLRLGISGAYSSGHMSLEEAAGSGDITTYAGAAYGSWSHNNFHFETVLSYSYNNYDDYRNIEVGPVARTARSSHDGQALGSYLSGGYVFQLNRWALEPFASFQYTYLDEEGFSESGAGSADLSVDGRDTQSLLSELGLRLARVFKGGTFSIIPELNVAWTHNFDIDDRDIESSFAGAPATAFSVPGRDATQNGLLTGAGVTLIFDNGISTSVRYNGETGDGYSGHSVQGELCFSF